jgi:hypothetical protein
LSQYTVRDAFMMEVEENKVGKSIRASLWYRRTPALGTAYRILAGKSSGVLHVFPWVYMAFTGDGFMANDDDNDCAGIALG